MTHDQEEALTLSDTIVVMSRGKIQQIGTPTGIYNEPANAFVADFIGESNILDGVMLYDCMVNVAGRDIPCVDKGFRKDEEVDVVIRPEDIEVSRNTAGAQFTGKVTSSIFKGVHYEMLAEADGYEFIIQDYIHYKVGETIGMNVAPDNIHIMHRNANENVFDAECDGGTVTFLGCEYPIEAERNTAEDGGEGRSCVYVPCDKVELTDNEQDGTFTGDVSFILYKGDHYHLTVDTDWGEKLYVDTQDQWDLGDRVGIIIKDFEIRARYIDD